MRPAALMSLALVAWLGAATGTAAQYPAKPVRLIVPYSPGGASEVSARAVAEALGKPLGQPVLVENRPGAEGQIAAQAVAGAPADGHTLLVGACSVHPQASGAEPQAPKAASSPIYFAAVSILGDLTYGLFVHPDVPARSAAELVSHVRANPGKLNYATITLAMEAAMARLFGSVDVPMTAVPYKGGAPAIADVLGGRIQVFFGPIGNGLGHAREGKVRLLATYPGRSPLAPQAQTLADAGISFEALPLSLTMCVHPRTPRAIVERLSREVNAVLEDPQVRALLEKQALTVRGSTPEQAAAELQQGVLTMNAFVASRKPR